MTDHLPALIAYTREKVKRLLAAQCGDPTSRNAGGFLWDDTGYADSRNSIIDGMTLLAAYVSPELPEHHGSADLLVRIRLLMGFMSRRQRANGTVMLGVSAAPGCAEVGFTLPGVCAVYARVRDGNLPARDELLAGLGQYLQRGAAACRTLRPHTANHRWTACAGPLACVDRLFPDPANRLRIDEFLADGFDLDADGLWFEERSPNYNLVANWGMLYLADHLGMRVCLDAAYANFRTILRFIQPNGEADSTFSHRQDRGAAQRPWGDYWLARRLAVEFNDGELATAADLLLARLTPDMMVFIPLLLLATEPRLRCDAVSRSSLPIRTELRCTGEPIWRWRDDQVAATVVADRGGHFWDVTYGRWGAPQRSNTVMSLHHGQAIIDGIKLTWGAGSGGFRPERINYAEDGSMLLTYRDYGQDHVAHYRPKESWDWTTLPYNQTAELRITRLANGGFRLDWRVDGELEVPINLQFLLRETGQLQSADGGHLSLTAGQRTFTAGGAYMLRGSDGQAWRISGLPASTHKVFIGDGSHIGGQAEQRCHRLVVGGFTPFTCSVELLPEPGNG